MQMTTKLLVLLTTFSLICSTQNFIVKNIDGKTYWCLTRDGVDSLVVKLATAVANKNDLDLANKQISVYQNIISLKDQQIASYDSLGLVYTNIIKQYEKTVKDLKALNRMEREPFYDSKYAYVIYTVATMYLAAKITQFVK